MKLYVTEKTDDEGIAYIEQVIFSGDSPFAIIKLRVKFGNTEQDLSRSVKHKDELKISKLIAKL